MANYEFWLTTDRGDRIALLDDFATFDGVRRVNSVGQFTMELGPAFDTTLIKVDRMVQVWRAATHGRMSLWNVYFIRRWEYAMTGSVERVAIGGPDAMDLLRRRVIPYGADQAQTRKNDQADDMIKAVVDENAVNDTSVPWSGSRDWANLTIEPALALGPTLEKAFAWGRLDRVCSDIAQAALEAGEEVFYAVEPFSVDGDTITFRLRVRIGQPGNDLTNTLVFAREYGNMADPMYEEDWTEEENYIYAAGQGVEESRYVYEVYDADRIGKSLWNRCEGFADARHCNVGNEVREEGRRQLERGRPRRRFSARIIETDGTQFGRDWEFGDKVRARYRGMEFDSIIRAMQIRVDTSRAEVIDARLEYQESGFWK